MTEPEPNQNPSAPDGQFHQPEDTAPESFSSLKPRHSVSPPPFPFDHPSFNSPTDEDMENILANLNEGILLLDKKLRIARFNNAGARVFRLAATDIGRNIEELAHFPEDRDPLLAGIHNVLARGAPLSSQINTPDGHWLTRRICPFISRGRIEGVILTFYDITELKLARDQLDLAMNASRLVWWEWHIPSDTLRVHASGECILGYSSFDGLALGQHWKELIHPDDRDEAMKGLQQCLKGESDEWLSEHRYRTFDGGWIWVFQKGTINQRDQYGNPISMVGTSRDINKRKEVQLNLDHSERFYRTIFNHTNTGIITLSPDGKILELNPAFARMIGYDQDQLVGKDYLPLVLFRDQPIAQHQFQDALANDAPTPIVEQRFLRHNDERIWVHATTMGIRDEHGKVLHLIQQVWDITDMKRNEEQSQTLREQLYQAQKLESIGTLAGGIAHDFNNILAAILGFSELACRRLTENEAALHDIGKVITAAKRAKSLVNQILTFSRQQSEQLQPIDMYLYVREAVDFLRASIPTTIEIRPKLDKNSGVIMADGTQIHQIVVNLCTNAAHAIQRKENQDGVIEVRLKRIEIANNHTREFPMLEPGPYLTLMIKDNGCGMDEATRNRIFEPFFTTKPPGEGTGLGLPVVHGIISQYHGHISVDSNPGEGTAFTLYFPAIQPEELPREPMEEGQAQVFSADNEASSPSLRILLVDDEKPITLMAKRLLEDAGYLVTIFSNSLKAFQHFEQSPQTYQLIITDQVMPGMTGCELGDAIRRMNQEVPILIITGYGHNLTAERLTQIGGVSTLMKPFGADELINTVRNLLPC